MIDSHAHLNEIRGIKLDDVVNDAKAAGVRKIIHPCSCPQDIEEVMEITDTYDNVYALLGIHPTEARNWSDYIEKKIIAYSKEKKVVGIGEIGLDYYWDKKFIDVQKEVFIKQIELANRLNLPMCIHDREAHQDTFDILKKYNKDSKVVLHSFSGSPEFAKECLKQGWYLSISGMVTFKNTVKVKEVAKMVPLDRLLIETDTPFQTPQPFKGNANMPAYLKCIAQEIADLRETSVEEIIEATEANTEKIFTLPC